MNLADFKAPFPVEELDWRIIKKSQNKEKALVVAFLNARAVMDRLDDTVGPENWRCAYVAGPKGGVVCQLGIRVDGEWITKEDGADNTEVEPVKGGISDALKRAAVAWGIGRYLYELPNYWVPVNQYGDFDPPTAKLPAWARPNGQARRMASEPAPEHVDHETGEIHEQGPAPQQPRNLESEADAIQEQYQANVANEPDARGDEWAKVKSVIDDPQSGIDRARLQAFLVSKGERGETAKEMFFAWMSQHPGRSAQVLIAQIRNERQPAGAAR